MFATTEEIHIILPFLFLIIGLRNIFDIVYKEFKFVLIVLNHCSSDILISKLSFVIPALLTTTSGVSEKSLFISEYSFSTECSSVISKIISRTFYIIALKLFLSPSVDCWFVPVPTIRKPSLASSFAMAKPIPLVAPHYKVLFFYFSYASTISKAVSKLFESDTDSDFILLSILLLKEVKTFLVQAQEVYQHPAAPYILSSQPI